VGPWLPRRGRPTIRHNGFSFPSSMAERQAMVLVARFNSWPGNRQQRFKLDPL